MSQKFIEGRIVGRKDHTATLFSLQFDAPLDTFVAGQFCRVGLKLNTEKGEEVVMRPYSLVNAPHERPFEIVLIKVEKSSGGILTPALHDLKIGDPLYVAPRANGFFSMPEVPAAQTLWGLSTGTAIGPYLSFMKGKEAWEKFEKIVFVHAVRTADELTYRDQIDAIAKSHPEQFQYVPFVSRQDHPGAIRGRIPNAIADGSLEARTGIKLTAETAHCMLCGNPDMVADTTTVLEARGLRKHKRKEPGHITTEAYW
jgi:ferredoxin/flavodoxin---NADP+ reductase